MINRQRPSQRIVGAIQLVVFCIGAACLQAGEGDADKTPEILNGLAPGDYAYILTNKGAGDAKEGEIVARLFTDLVPRTAGNFIGLANGTKTYTHPKTNKKQKGHYYDGIIFHRVISDFMIQTGDPLGVGRGDPGYKFKDEFHPKLRHDKPGIFSMANSGPNTNGSQFFITVAPTAHLDDKHSVFGEVVKGMDDVYAISKVPVIGQRGSRPVKTVKMKQVRCYTIASEGAEPMLIVPEGMEKKKPAPAASAPASKPTSKPASNPTSKSGDKGKGKDKKE